jgi:hypothetical protein
MSIDCSICSLTVLVVGVILAFPHALACTVVTTRLAAICSGVFAALPSCAVVSGTLLFDVG